MAIDHWRRTVYLFSASAFCIFIVNLSLTVWAGSRLTGIQDGVGVLWEGDCETVKSLDSGIHALINLLSTILVAGSNYCMQCLVAPTRSQIDRAHKAGRFLDIGVQSMRNLSSVNWTNLGLWFVLALSSVPLHLFYNSAVLTSMSANWYNQFVTNETFLAAGQFQVSGGVLWAASLESPQLLLEATRPLHQALSNGTLARLSAADCVEAYGQPFQSRWSNVVLVTSSLLHDPTAWSAPLHGAGTAFLKGGCGVVPASAWVCQRGDPKCPAPCGPQLAGLRLDAAASGWRPDGYFVEACLAVPTQDHCKLQVSMPLCILVVVVNFAKAAAMLAVATAVGERPLTTLGDAIKSFLERPDATTEGMCLKTSKAFRWETQPWTRGPQKFKGGLKRKFAAVSGSGWFLYIALFTSAILTCVGFFAYGASPGSSGLDLVDLLALGLAPQEGSTLIISELYPRDLALNALLANTPQVVMSVIYFYYNSMITSICLATEYSSFAKTRKGLRVSGKPREAQRSAYFLQLPYKYSIPLAATSAVIHWLISQTIYLVKIDMILSPSVAAMPVSERNRVGDVLTDSLVTCGWSPLGLLLTFSFAAPLAGALVFLAWRRFDSAIPVAGSCSAAISAACHPTSDFGQFQIEGAWELPLKWGTVPQAGEGDVVGHCAFSAGPVSPPIEGREYM